MSEQILILEVVGVWIASVTTVKGQWIVRAESLEEVKRKWNDN